MPLDQFVNIPVGPAAAPVVLPKGGSAFKPGGQCLARSAGAAVLYGVNLLPRNSANSTRVRGENILARTITATSFPGIDDADIIDAATLDHTNMLDTVVLVNGVAATRVGSDAAPGAGEFSISTGAKGIATVDFSLLPAHLTNIILDDGGATELFEFDDGVTAAAVADANIDIDIQPIHLNTFVLTDYLGVSERFVFDDSTGNESEATVTFLREVQPGNEITLEDWDGTIVTFTFGDGTGDTVDVGANFDEAAANLVTAIAASALDMSGAYVTPVLTLTQGEEQASGDTTITIDVTSGTEEFEITTQFVGGADGPLSTENAIDVGASTTDAAANALASINGVGGLAITASAGAGDSVDLVQDGIAVYPFSGNTTITLERLSAAPELVATDFANGVNDISGTAVDATTTMEAALADFAAEVNASATIGMTATVDGSTVVLIQDDAGVAGNTTTVSSTSTTAEFVASNFTGGTAAGTTMTFPVIPGDTDLVEVYTGMTPVLIDTLVAGVTVNIEPYDVITTGVAVAQLMG